jgi:tetratricopeptide (TPR) repeat protein
MIGRSQSEPGTGFLCGEERAVPFCLVVRGRQDAEIDDVGLSPIHASKQLLKVSHRKNSVIQDALAIRVFAKSVYMVKTDLSAAAQDGFAANRFFPRVRCQRCRMISALVDNLAKFYEKGNLAQVEAIARSMLTAIPDDVVALAFLALALYQMGRIDDAHQAFQRVAARVEQHEESIDDTRCELASAAMFRAATQAHSGLADGWSRIAYILNRLGLQKPAARVFQAALSARGLIKTIPIRARDTVKKVLSA